jgi:ABC-type ATPase with predicted acetyltransferase domain
MTRWRCETCGQVVEVRAVSAVPVCAHRGTSRSAAKAAAMVVDDLTIVRVA